MNVRLQGIRQSHRQLANTQSTVQSTRDVSETRASEIHKIKAMESSDQQKRKASRNKNISLEKAKVSLKYRRGISELDTNPICPETDEKIYK